MDQIGELGITSNLEFQREFSLLDGDIPTAMAAFTADGEGYISDSVMSEYRKEVRAIPEDGQGVTVVKVGESSIRGPVPGGSCNLLQFRRDSFV